MIAGMIIIAGNRRRTYFVWVKTNSRMGGGRGGHVMRKEAKRGLKRSCLSGLELERSKVRLKMH